MSREGIQAVRAVYDAWNAGGLEAAIGVLPEDITWETPPNSPEPGVLEGSEGARNSMQSWLDEWGSLEIDDLVLEDLGDLVLASCTQRATGRTSGALVESSLYMLWTSSGGKLTRMRMFLDEDEARAAAG